MTNAQILRDAAYLIETPGVWIQGAYARRNPTGHTITTDHPDARCFDMAGAVYKLARPFNRGCYRAAPPLIACLGFLCGMDCDDWNDQKGRTAPEVAEMLRTAARVIDGGIEPEPEEVANADDQRNEADSLGNEWSAIASGNDRGGDASERMGNGEAVPALPTPESFSVDIEATATTTGGTDQGVQPDSQPGGLRNEPIWTPQTPGGLERFTVAGAMTDALSSFNPQA